MLFKTNNNNIESMRENQIVVSDIKNRNNDTFDEFYEYKMFFLLIMKKINMSYQRRKILSIQS